MSNRATKLVGSGIAPAAALAIVGGQDVQLNLTATGNSQASALAVYGDNVQVVNTPAASGVIAFQGPSVSPGDDQFIQNLGANPLLVYPPVGGSINTLGLNNAYSLPSGKSLILRALGGNGFATVVSA